MVCAEYALFHLKKDVTKSTIEASKVYKECLDLVSSQAGCQRVYTGFGIEDSTRLTWILEWDAFEAHKTFMDKTDIYKPFVDHLMSFADNIEMFHYEFQPPLSSIWSSERSVIEQYTIIYNLETSEQQELDAMKYFVDECGEPVKATFAVSRENKQQTLMLLSWESIEKHYEWKQGYAGFQQALSKIKALSKDSTMFHAKMSVWE